MTTVRVRRIGAPITVLGPGTRVALWVQGCTIGCAGCASTETWAPGGGVERTVRDVADELLRAAASTDATGLTISGGEPFQQAEQLTELLDLVREEWPAGQPDILIFTGYAASAARRRSVSLWSAADIVIAGPYRADRPSEHPLLGSSNQTIDVLSALGAQRMPNGSDGQRPLQVGMHDGRLVVVGMPDPGDLDRLRSALDSRGVHLTDVSWAADGGTREA